jgi:Flavodoxin-like fold
VRRLTVGSLTSIADSLTDSQALETALEDIQWATQLIVVFPLWMDQMPPVLYDLFEENLARGNLDFGPAGEKPVRTVITMEFPALFLRALLQCGMYVGGSRKTSLAASRPSRPSNAAGGLPTCGKTAPGPPSWILCTRRYNMGRLGALVDA